jgi:hypothetical protein
MKPWSLPDIHHHFGGNIPFPSSDKPLKKERYLSSQTTPMKWKRRPGIKL